jgi:hypothetical protein
MHGQPQHGDAYATDNPSKALGVTYSLTAAALLLDCPLWGLGLAPLGLGRAVQLGTYQTQTLGHGAHLRNKGEREEAAAATAANEPYTIPGSVKTRDGIGEKRAGA